MKRQTKTMNRDILDFSKYSEEEVRQIILDMKISSVIAKYAELYGVSLEEATELFYNSSLAQLIEERVADLHCRSDIYLADELHLELENKK